MDTDRYKYYTIYRNFRWIWSLYIINLNIPNGGDNVGLIGYNTGTIKNVKLNNISITGISNVGGIAGYSSGNIIGTQSIGTINGAVNVGGIVRIYNWKFKWK